MRLRLSFGDNQDQRELEWDKHILDFPTLVSFYGKNWEWSYYDADKSKSVDYLLFFKALNANHPMHMTEAPTLNEIMSKSKGCQHDWKEYFGLQRTFDYCTKCGVKR